LEYIFILRFGHCILILDSRKILWIGKTSYGLCTPWEGKSTMDSFKKQLQGRQPRKVENSVAIQLGRDPAYESHKKMALGKKPAAEP